MTQKVWVSVGVQLECDVGDRAKALSVPGVVRLQDRVGRCHAEFHHCDAGQMWFHGSTQRGFLRQRSHEREPHSVRHRRWVTGLLAHVVGDTLLLHWGLGYRWDDCPIHYLALAGNGVGAGSLQSPAIQHVGVHGSRSSRPATGASRPPVSRAATSLPHGDQPAGRCASAIPLSAAPLYRGQGERGSMTDVARKGDRWAPRR